MKKKIEFIKICGLTDPETASACANAGANAIGLVFFKKSPRNISEDTALRICRALPPDILTTGVFVNESYNYIMDKVKKLSLKAVQLHGRETPELVEALKKENLITIKALFAKKQPFLKDAHFYKHVSYLLAECGKGVLPGGNAESWNWSDTAAITSNIPIILAGGLTPENINKALNMADVNGIDISSGVESSPGIKDLNKVNHFMKQIRMLQ